MNGPSESNSVQLNAKQQSVLHWIIRGCPSGVYPEGDYSHRITARALETRGLVRLRGHGPSWEAVPTDRGNAWPQEPEQGRDVPARKAQQSTHPELPDPAPAPSTPAKEGESIPIPSQIRKPHRAVREIMDHKARPDVPAEHRQRALIILHAVAQEALRRGWQVIPNPSTFTRDPWNSRRTRISPGADLFSVDAGDSPAAIRLRMKQKRVDYVPTEEERARAERYGWRSYPKYDYVPTERMRLEIRNGSYSSLVLEDTAGTRIEDKLLRAFEKIAEMSVKAREAAERRRLRELELAEARRREAELRARAQNYSEWAEALEILSQQARRHHELVDVVTELRAAVEQRDPNGENYAKLTEYLRWAEHHVQESDPFRRRRSSTSSTSQRPWTGRPVSPSTSSSTPRSSPPRCAASRVVETRVEIKPRTSQV